MNLRAWIRFGAAFSIFLLAFAASGLAGPALERIKASGELVVATDPAWEPMSWRKSNGEFAGFDVDVSKEIARRLGANVRFYMPYSFDAVLAGGWAGKWDIATSVTPTVQRAQKVVFAGVYWYTVDSLAVHRDNTSISSASDASGKRIGVIRGTEYEKYLTREPFDIIDMPPISYKIDHPKIVRFDDGDALCDALAKGDGVELDAVFESLNGLMERIKNGAPLRIVGMPLLYTPGSIVVDQGDPELATTLHGVIEAMRKDGTLARLSMKWFDYDLTHP